MSEKNWKTVTTIMLIFSIFIMTWAWATLFINHCNKVNKPSNVKTLTLPEPSYWVNWLQSPYTRMTNSDVIGEVTAPGCIMGLRSDGVVVWKNREPAK